MALVTDIPTRDGKDGAAQLALLRVYLKDTDNSKYQFPDALLIPQLVAKDRVLVWRELTGYGSKAVPWSYDPMALGVPVNRIRAVTGDTVEATLKYTDYELLRLLNIIPLRYVVSMIKAVEANGKTFPEDPNDPLHILRKYLMDETGTKYTDIQLINMIIKSGLDPFAVVLAVMDKSMGSNSSSKVITTGTNLASLDGISFSSPSEEIKQSKAHRDVVSENSLTSVYNKEPIYATYIDNVNVAAVAWEVEWYAL